MAKLSGQKIPHRLHEKRRNSWKSPIRLDPWSHHSRAPNTQPVNKSKKLLDSETRSATVVRPRPQPQSLSQPQRGVRQSSPVRNEDEHITDLSSDETNAVADANTSKAIKVAASKRKVSLLANSTSVDDNEDSSLSGFETSNPSDVESPTNNSKSPKSHHTVKDASPKLVTAELASSKKLRDALTSHKKSAANTSHVTSVGGQANVFDAHTPAKSPAQPSSASNADTVDATQKEKARREERRKRKEEKRTRKELRESMKSQSREQVGDTDGFETNSEAVESAKAIPSTEQAPPVMQQSAKAIKESRDCYGNLVFSSVSYQESPEPEHPNTPKSNKTKKHARKINEPKLTGADAVLAEAAKQAAHLSVHFATDAANRKRAIERAAAEARGETVSSDSEGEVRAEVEISHNPSGSTEQHKKNKDRKRKRSLSDIEAAQATEISSKKSKKRDEKSKKSKLKENAKERSVTVMPEAQTPSRLGDHRSATFLAQIRELLPASIVEAAAKRLNQEEATYHRQLNACARAGAKPVTPAGDSDDDDHEHDKTVYFDEAHPSVTLAAAYDLLILLSGKRLGLDMDESIGSSNKRKEQRDRDEPQSAIEAEMLRIVADKSKETIHLRQRVDHLETLVARLRRG